MMSLQRKMKANTRSIFTNDESFSKDDSTSSSTVDFTGIAAAGRAWYCSRDVMDWSCSFGGGLESHTGPRHQRAKSSSSWGLIPPGGVRGRRADFADAICDKDQQPRCVASKPVGNHLCVAPKGDWRRCLQHTRNKMFCKTCEECGAVKFQSRKSLDFNRGDSSFRHK